MNNDLEKFSEERLKKIAFLEGSGCVVYQANEVAALARIALAAKQAKPVGIYNQQLFNLQGSAVVLNIDKSVEAGFVSDDGELSSSRGYLYATPQPAHTEQGGWTSSDAANAALVMLDRIDTTDPVDDDRIEGIQRIIRQLATAPKSDFCQWNPDEDSVYSTGCGKEWQFTDGGLEDNQIKFCPYCSGKIATPKPESE